jgi:hypothetical protein
VNGNGTRPVPLLGAITLQYVQTMAHALAGGFAATRIAGLAGEVQQRTGRPSHRIEITGVLFGEKTADDLKALQAAASEGTELTFAADISTALDLQRVVITSFRAVEVAGQPHHVRYEIALAESPPLPPPAQLEPFGGLGDFGLGDLGFDEDLLGELENLAGQAAGAVDAAMDAVDQLQSLAGLADLGGLALGGFLQPLGDWTGGVGRLGGRFLEAGRGVGEAFTT